MEVLYASIKGPRLKPATGGEVKKAATSSVSPSVQGFVYLGRLGRWSLGMGAHRHASPKSPGRQYIMDVLLTSGIRHSSDEEHWPYFTKFVHGMVVQETPNPQMAGVCMLCHWAG